MDFVWIALLTGLTIGGFSCLAIQGGLLASTIASQKNHTRAVALFLFSKLLSYTALGVALGFFGSFFILTPKVQGIIQIIAGIFMLLTAAQLTKLHPFLRFFIINPPKWVYKLTIKESEKDSFLTPVILGLLTILLPCGTTQAMMALALSTGSSLAGAAILFAFTLGTIPVFILLGAASSKLLKTKILNYVTAICIVYLALVSINSGLVLRGSFYTFQNFYKAATTDIYAADYQRVAPINQGKQEVDINVTNNGYSSSSQVLKAGVPVKLTLSTKNSVNCTRDFVIPSQNISKVLPENGTEVVEFTPTKTGPLTYSCGMGMYSGQFTVVN